MTQIPDDFGFQADHGTLRQMARRLLAERAPLSRTRELCERGGDDEGHAFDSGLYQDMVGLCWVGLDIDAARGGMGMGALTLSLLLEQMGRVLLPSPFLACSLAARALATVTEPRTAIDDDDEEEDESGEGDDSEPSTLDRIIGGDCIATVALSEPGRGAAGLALDYAHVQTSAAVDGDDTLVLRGEKNHVMWGTEADLVLVPARLRDEQRLGWIAVPLPCEGVEVSPEIGIDPTRRTARLRFDGARLPATALVADADDAERISRELLARGLTMVAAEVCGALEGVLELTATYAKERLQFGKPIGAFQAVKHPIVDVMVDVELARSLAYAAAAAIDAGVDDDEQLQLARMAKVKACEAYHHAAGRGVQLHGGFGFTYDCDVHFHVKRALFARATLGDATLHRRALAAALFDGDTRRAALAVVERGGLTLSM
ncbi:MAG: acyl-CoA/acyl-ACP dehydrogenase [Myxococcales bacterium]|nr:acyl-CoA/acyl-ACP dehydrogenase [Myxococcales bacterium]